MNRHFTLLKALTAILFFLGIALGQSAFAQTSWSISASTSGTTTTFTISRSGDLSSAVTVKYRTIGLSAYEGQHFNVMQAGGVNTSASSGNLTIPANENSTTVKVTETDANTDAYIYHNGTSRTYRLEVTDMVGFQLAYKDRSMTTGTQFNAAKVSKSITDLVYFNEANYASAMSSSKYLDVNFSIPNGWAQTSGTYQGFVLIDDSYDYTKYPATVSTSSLISSTNATASYLNSLGYKIYATVCFTMKEKDDGYYYIQIVPGDANAAYDTGYDPNGAVNDPSNSVYKSCFELKKGSGTYSGTGKQFYPHRYNCHDQVDCGQNSSHTEFYLSDSYLWEHKYKSGYRASESGSVVFAPTVANITTRFDCGGSNDDTYGYKDFFVRMALCDANAPTILDVNSIVVAGGIYGYGNTVYVTVPFKEIVTVTGTPKLATTWGELSYTSGSGTNVLTFKGNITGNVGTSLTVNSISGTIKDLAGNSYNTSTSINKSFNLTVVRPWTGSGTQNDPYIISNTAQLDWLAKETWGGYTGNTNGNWFENTYFKLGADIAYSHTSSNTWNSTSSFTSNFTSIGGWGHSFKGHFDGDGHSISGIRIYKNGSANEDECQGLFGMVYGTTVKNLVLYDINIVGKNQVGVLEGNTGGTIQDCYIYNARAHATSGSNCGIIYGSGSSTVTRAYYKDGMIGSNAGQHNIGKLTMNNGVTVSRTPVTTLNANVTLYGDGATINGAEYYTSGTTVTLGYNGSVPQGSFVKYTATTNGGDITYSNINGNVLTMPDADVTVNATLMPVVTYLDADGNAQQCSDYTVITSSDSDVNLGTSDKTHWYVVNSNATINAKLYFHGNTNLILCDGATLTVNRNGTAVIANEFDNFNIFGQTNGNGTLNAASLNNSGITSRHLGIYGGIVSASAPNEGIHAGAYSITLGYTTPANRFTASSYYCSSLIVKSGQTLTDGEGLLYSGTYTGDGLDAALAALAGKTLQPAYSLVVPTNFSVTGITAPQGFAPAGETVTLHTAEGYTITAASYTPEGGSATDITPVEGVWSFTMPAANTMVNATRSVNTYTVHFDANATNGINATGTMTDQTFTYDEAQSLTANTFARTGYTFNGWNTAADGTGTAYTNQQSVSNLTNVLNGVVTLYAQWTLINWTGGGTSESDPYLILYASQLVKLADDVNGGNQYNGEYFKLGNDIDMSGVAFDGIGTGDDINHSFSGNFDGDGKTISNVTVDRGLQVSYVGFFGYVENGTVCNLILNGAFISGYTRVGVLIGSNYNATIRNCLVLNSSVSGYENSYVGVISGDKRDNGTLTGNYYRNCTFLGTANATNVGVGNSNIYPLSGAHDLAGARSVHTLALPEHVLAQSTETVVIDAVTYYASNVSVTLSNEDANIGLTNVTVNGTPATNNGDGTWSFTMPAADATVTCSNSVPYIDTDGNLAFCTSFTVIESNQGTYGTNAQECWFVVSGDVTINGILLKGTISHLILCDGATLTINQTNDNDGLQTSNNLIIYGQSVGNGTLTVSAPWVGLNTNNDLIINGGIISATSTTSSGITAGLGNITINRGSVTARGYYDGIYGQNIFINGGIVNATNGEGSNSYGITADLDITLGYTELTDRITSSSYKSYNGTVSVKAGQFLTDGTTAAYIGTLNNDQISALAGQTLQPCFSLTLPEHVVATGVISQSGTTAYAVPGAEVTIAGAPGYSITLVTFNGNNATSNLDGSYTFTMPAENVTVSIETIDLIYYDIDYDLAGGSVATPNPESYNVEYADFTLVNPTREGFIFGGWTGTDLNGPTLEVTIAHGSTGNRSYTATWNANIAEYWGNGDGSLNAPYVITTTTGLNLLATLVNEGNTYEGQYFELGNDIDYVSNTTANYTAIGTETHAFGGTFDGKGYAVKNFHIESSTGYQGLFGHLAANGTVKNTVVDNAVINDNENYIAGIAGLNDGSIENCLIINTVFSNGFAWPIATITSIYDINITNSYYRNCTLGYYSSSDCFTVSAGEHVTVGIVSYDKGLTYNGVVYVPTEATLSLNLGYDNLPSGQAPVFFASTGTLSGTGNPYTLVTEDMEDVTITAMLGIVNVPYLDADGVEQTCALAQLITSGTSEYSIVYAGQWFVVDGNVTVTPGIHFEKDAHLIIKDGATLNTGLIYESRSLTIYAQSEGDNMGVINATIGAEGLTINGGIINANQDNESGLFSNRGDLVINSGRITANLINADYEEHKGTANIILGWRNTGDYIYADLYLCNYGTVQIKSGCPFTNGTEILNGTVSDLDKLNEKHLRPAPPVPYIDADGQTAYCSNYTLLNGSNDYVTYGDDTEAWYVVNHNVTYHGGLTFYGDANLILVDGATLTDDSELFAYNKLNIYVQEGGTGAIVGDMVIASLDDFTIHGGHITTTNYLQSYQDLTINGGQIAIETNRVCVNVSNNLTINGGTLDIHTTANNTYQCTVYADGDVVINGGDLTVTNESSITSSRCIMGSNSVTINGGKVRAYGKGIAVFYGAITLGWTDAENDLILSKGGFSAWDVNIATGKAFTDGTSYYIGTLSDSQISDLAGKTLTPYTDFNQTFNISYVTNGGTLPGGYPQTYTFDETVTLPVPTKEDNTFAGWYRDSYCNDGPVTEIAAGTTLGNLTLYALWKPEKTWVDYLDANGQPQRAYATILYGGDEAEYPAGVYSLEEIIWGKSYGGGSYNRLNFTGDAILILPDYGDLNIGAPIHKDDEDGLFVSGDLTIYGQTGGFGSCNATRIQATGKVDIYGGDLYIDNLSASNITLGWTGLENTYSFNHVAGNVTLANGFRLQNDQGTSVVHAGSITSSELEQVSLYPYATRIDISYMDENGDTQTVNATVLWGDETNLSGGFYTIMEYELYIDHDLSFNDNTTLIVPRGYLAIGGNLTVGGNLSVYGYGYFDMNNNSYDIQATGDVLFCVYNADMYYSKLTAGGNVFIAQGRFDANKIVGKTITLGYLSTFEFIRCGAFNEEGGYSGNVVVREGQALQQGGNVYSGTLTAEQISAIKGKELIPYIPTMPTLAVTGYGESTESDHWVFIASPIVGSLGPDNVTNLIDGMSPSGQSNFDLYRFNQSAELEWENYYQHLTGGNSFALENGKGYLYANKNDVTLEFSGAVYPAASKEVALDYDANATFAGWNLVGNPFNAPAILDKSYYKMNSDGTGLVAEAVSGNTAIDALTGVMVKAEGQDETVLFTKSNAKGQQETGFGTLQIALTQAGNRGNALLDNAIVSFNEGDELGKFYFGTQDANIYIPQNNKEFAIAYAGNQTEMPLNFKAHKNGEYTLIVSYRHITPNGVTYLHLVDHLTGADIDLLETPSYTFNAHTSDYASRFKLVFNANGAEGNDDFAFIDADGNLIVNGDGTLQVFDILGHQLLSRDVNSAFRIPHSAFSPGIYVLRLINGEKVKTQKIVIR